MRIQIWFIICLLAGYVDAQVVDIDFDGCALTNAGALDDPLLNGSLECDCGIEGESLLLTEAGNSLNFDSTYTDYFQRDFTLSFYFMVRDNAPAVNDILSVSTSCRVDSTMTIKYFSQESIVRVQIAENFDLFVEMDAEVNQDFCWHQLVVVRSGQQYFLYIDGTFAEEGFANGNIVLDPSATMKIGNSPCQDFGESPFLGKIDEFKIYDRALSVVEVFEDFVLYDQLITNDTTIFSGTSVDVESHPSCADIVTWFPSQNVDSPVEIEPAISPLESTFYRVRYDYGICLAQDSLSITIIDEEAVDCENLLIPNAFTPNNDGLNDMIGISNDFIIEDLRSFEIYDRWGEKVFDTSVKTDRWDGTFRGQRVNPNVFLYKVNYSCKGEDFIKTGSFSILR